MKPRRGESDRALPVRFFQGVWGMPGGIPQLKTTEFRMTFRKTPNAVGHCELFAVGAFQVGVARHAILGFHAFDQRRRSLMLAVAVRAKGRFDLLLLMNAAAVALEAAVIGDGSARLCVASRTFVLKHFMGVRDRPRSVDFFLARQGRDQ